MNVKAKAEEGLLISNASNGTYGASATATNTAVTSLLPGSTFDFSYWLKSSSNLSGSASTQNAYEAASEWTANESGKYGNYVHHDFFIRSSLKAAADANPASTVSIASLKINGVTIESNLDAHDNISKALRVGIKVARTTNNTEVAYDAYIYAPVTGGDPSNSIQPAVGAYATEGRKTVTPLAATTVSTDANVNYLPDNTSAGAQVTIYVWYEGEDSNCTTDYVAIATEELSISVEFGFNPQA